MKAIRVTLVLGAIALLALASGAVVAQDSGQPQDISAIDATVAPAISYQGRLVDPATGDPFNGHFDLEFSFWSADVGGTQVWPATVRSNQEVTDGLYRTELPVDVDMIQGQELWLQIRVRETGTSAWDSLNPRIEVLPTVYALTLRPGARMEDAIDRPNAVINATSTSHGFGLRGESRNLGGYGILGYLGSGSPDAYGAGVKGSVMATGYGVIGSSDTGHGVGVAGYTEDGYGVFGVDGGTVQGRGYAGYFNSRNGVGVYGVSGADSTGDNLYAPGVYGRSLYGTGVYGRSDGVDSDVSAGVLGWGNQGPGGVFVTSGTSILEAWRQVDPWTTATVFRVESEGDVFADGAYHCGLDDGGSVYIEETGACMYDNSPADFAEVLPVTGMPEPADVLIINAEGNLAPSTEPYQPTVAGVYSTDPSYVGNAAQLGTDGHVPLAIVGVVPVKASAENGPIVPGDLLVASASPGHCMRAGPNPPVGTIIGKALEGLSEGTGIIQMLVTLQ